MSDTKLNYYLVTLRLFLGEYEKHTQHLVKSENREAAELKALQNESHSAKDFDKEGDGQWWDCGEFVYRADYVRELTEDEFKTMQRLTKTYGYSGITML